MEKVPRNRQFKFIDNHSRQRYFIQVLVCYMNMCGRNCSAFAYCRYTIFNE